MKTRLFLAVFLAVMLMAVPTPVAAGTTREAVTGTCYVEEFIYWEGFREWTTNGGTHHFQHQGLILECESSDPRLGIYWFDDFGWNGRFTETGFVGLDHGHGWVTDAQGNLLWETMRVSFYEPDGSWHGSVVAHGAGENTGLQARLDLEIVYDPDVPYGLYLLVSGSIIDPGK